ncbi:MAG TPA: PH domain-containing protein [Blastocatellia bacterium]|nr:PH domain-containing protein [Blastocatellia bacterium]
MTRLKAVAGNQGGAGSIKPVMTDQPDMRLIKVGYLVPLFLVAAGVFILLLPTSEAVKIGVGYALIMALGGILTYLLSSHARLRRANYMVTAEYIEAQTGTFEKTSRRIPLSYVRDVTHRQHFFQTLFDVSDIKVTATNGDSVVFENVSDGRRKQEVIWGLVIARSPGASQSRNANQ